MKKTKRQFWRLGFFDQKCGDSFMTTVILKHRNIDKCKVLVIYTKYPPDDEFLSYYDASPWLCLFVDTFSDVSYILLSPVGNNTHSCLSKTWHVSLYLCNTDINIYTMACSKRFNILQKQMWFSVNVMPFDFTQSNEMLLFPVHIVFKSCTVE